MSDHHPLDQPIATVGRRRVLGLVGLAAAACTTMVFASTDIAAAAATAAAAGAANLNSSAAGSCRLSTLPVPDGTWRSDVTAGDPTGKYRIGEAGIVQGDQSSVVSLLWVDGALTPFPTPYQDATLRDVNSTGAIVGYTRDAGFHTHAWLYSNGRFALLPGVTASDETMPQAINERGDVVGYSNEPDNPPNAGVRRAVIWPADSPGTVRELTVPRQVPGFASADDIDDDGTVIGVADSTAGRATYVWSPGGRAHVLRGPAGTTDIGTVGIRNGWIAGWENQSPHAVAVRWNLRNDSATVISTDNLPYSVNGRGDVGMYLAIAHRDGRLVRLPSLNDSGSGAVRALSDLGSGAGFSYDGTQVRAVVWTGC